MSFLLNTSEELDFARLLKVNGGYGVSASCSGIKNIGCPGNNLNPGYGVVGSGVCSGSPVIGIVNTPRTLPGLYTDPREIFNLPGTTLTGSNTTNGSCADYVLGILSSCSTTM